MANKKNQTVVGSVSLYGGVAGGAGYLAFIGTGTGMVPAGGSGEPVARWSLTDAMFVGLDKVRDALPADRWHRGLVEVHYDFPAIALGPSLAKRGFTGIAGPRMALVDLAKPFPYFGELTWLEGRVYVVFSDEILAAAEKN